MRQPTREMNDHAVRLNHTTMDGWLALFGGPDFIARRPPEGAVYIVSAI